MDLLALPDRTDVARKLLMEACTFFRESCINVVHYRVVKNHPHQTIFSEQGFIEVPSKMHLTHTRYTSTTATTTKNAHMHMNGLHTH
jgi:hypothetical protein